MVHMMNFLVGRMGIHMKDMVDPFEVDMSDHLEEGTVVFLEVDMADSLEVDTVDPLGEDMAVLLVVDMAVLLGLDTAEPLEVDMAELLEVDMADPLEVDTAAQLGPGLSVGGQQKRGGVGLMEARFGSLVVMSMNALRHMREAEEQTQTQTYFPQKKALQSHNETQAIDI